MIVLLVGEWIVVITVILIEIFSGKKLGADYNTVRMCGYAKALITLVKYMPQVIPYPHPHRYI